jgi:hypothetical protein
MAITGSPPKGSVTLPARAENSGLRRAFLWVARAVVIVYVVLDAIVTPVFRPLLRWLARLQFVIRLEDIIAALPPYAILVLLLIPFAFAEPAKIYALYLIGAGHISMGVITMAMAYILSLVVGDRIYHAGQAKLKTIRWFALLMEWLVGIRDRLLAFARSSPIWAFSVRLKRQARALIARVRVRFRAGKV